MVLGFVKECLHHVFLPVKSPWVLYLGVSYNHPERNEVCYVTECVCTECHCTSKQNVSLYTYYSHQKDSKSAFAVSVGDTFTIIIMLQSLFGNTGW